LFQGRWTRLSIAAGVLATVASMAAPSFAGTVTFGSVGNTFNMEFVTIGNPNNAADSGDSRDGSVGYTFNIGKFEVSEEMITKYNANFGTTNNLEITQDNRGDAKPATSVSWNEAARFVNWLNTSTGNQAAYKFAVGSAVNDNIQLWTSGEAGYDVNNKYRNSLAKYFLPSFTEFYKATYYDPNKSGPGVGGYWDYATGSDIDPTAVASGTGAGTAVYGGGSVTGPADVDKAGGLSPYGVMGLGGNVWEWEETSGVRDNSQGPDSRGYRGGSWSNPSGDMLPGVRGNASPDTSNSSFGFRVASLSSDAAVPEPSMMVIGTLFGLGGLMAKRRMKK
jgi:formylglycine-generating enzyme required for sulfatase activity